MQKQVQLVFTDEIGNATLQVFNAAGQVKINRTLQAVTGQSIDLSLDGLAAGVYYIKVITGTRTISKKLVIQ